MPSPLQRAVWIAAALLIVIAPSDSAAGDGVAQPAFAWKSFDGTAFPVLKWLPKAGKQPEAAVVCVHGLSGAASDFEQLGEKLSAAGHAVYAYNLRGQGKDPERKRVGDIKKREHWFADLDSFITLTREQHPDTPLFVYGESLGSLIVMNGFAGLAAENRAAVEGIVFGSPVIALPGDIPRLKYFLLKVLIKALPGVKVSMLMLAGGQAARVSGDDEVDHWEQMKKTPHFVSRMSFRLLGTIESMVKSSARSAAPIEKPILVLYPGKDLFTTPAQVEAFYKILESKDKTKRLFSESHHLLFYDKEREEVFELVEQWVEKRS